MLKAAPLLALLASALLSVSAAPQSEPDVTFVPGAYIVEFEDGQDEASFYRSLDRSSIQATPRMSLSYQLFHGASFRLKNTTHTNPEEIALRIASSPEVKKLWPVRLFSVPRDEVHWTGNDAPQAMPASLQRRQGEQQPDADTDTFSPHLMTQVEQLRADGVTGEGIKVAIVDTGIDYLHPALGGGFGPGFLVSYGTDLAGDNYTGDNTPVPDDDPIDECAGHGTHVAGIVAAQANPLGFTGTAPGVTLGAYRVFGCGGNAGNDVLIAAFNRAYEDGSDIITASIGGASGWSEDPWAVAVQRIVEAGVPCTVSAGNSGSEGIFYASTAAGGKGVISVASVDNTEAPAVLLHASFSTTEGETSFGWNRGDPSAWGNISLPLYSRSLNTSEPADACTAYPDDTPDLSGYIVLIRRGSCTFVEKLANAAAKGAKYVMVYNNAVGTLAVSATAVSGISGVGMVTREQGAQWIELLAAGTTVTLNIIDPTYASQSLSSTPNTATGGFLSTYTSWGPNFELDVKQQISAPGGLILSTFPRALGSYAVLSGTSMACPQTAGVVALIAQVRGTKDPRTIESLLSATANPQLFNDGATTSPFLAPVAQQGGGLIQAYDAAHSTTLLSVSSLALNDSANFIQKSEFSIKNTGSQEATYELGYINAATTYAFATGSVDVTKFPNELTTIGASLTFGGYGGYGSNSVTVGPGEEVTVEVDVTQPPGLDATRLPVYSGYITLNSTTESLSLPFLGVAGNMYDATVLAGGKVSASDDEDQTPISNGTVFTLPKSGMNSTSTRYPAIIPNLVLGTRSLLMEVVPVQSAGTRRRRSSPVTSIGQVFSTPLEYLPRGGLSVQWDGKLADQSYAPTGEYTIVTRALRIFGDPEKPEDYMTWESVPFGIKYV